MIRNASLKIKLTVGFGLVLVILVTKSAVDYFSIQNISHLSAAVDATAEEVYRARTIDALDNSRKTDIRSFLLSGDEEHMSKYQGHNRALADEMGKLEPLLTTEESRNFFAQLKQAVDAYGQSAQRVADLKRAHKMQAATDLLFGPAMSAQRVELENSLTGLIKRCQELETSARREQTRAEAAANRVNIALGMIGLVISLIATTIVPRYLSSNISKMLVVIEEIAAKNLAIEDMIISSADEVGNAGTALNTMKNSLRSLIQSIARTAEHVASASEEISSSATQQAQTAETQKGQAAQVSVAMQEMSSAVHEVSENSNRAAGASHQAAETARDGGTIVEESLAKMRAIAESVSATAHKLEDLGKSSDQIGRIIGVIDDIADQTNLLALNAAIEAARAGEQGRGFAVVADEVRKLAERTTSATKEVAHMVQSIQNETRIAVAAMHEGTRQVQEGVQTTARAGDSLKQIIQMSEQVGEMVAHIATAATQQSSATEQVNQNVEQITRLVNESAVGAQQSAKACQDLSGLALDLQKMVSSFHLEGNRPSWLQDESDVTGGIRAFAAGAS
jgi:methyl-accepting chemotaxis protein